MKFTTHFELHSQTTRLVEGVSHGLGRRPHTGFSPSMTSCSKELRPTPRPKHPLQITTRTPKRPDFKFELLPLHSPLLRQSLLVSFPPLIDMLKFSGYPYLIRGQPLINSEFVWPARSRNLPKRDREILLRLKSRWTATEFRAHHGGEAQYQAVLEGCNDARTGMPFGIPKGAMCVQRLDDSRNSAIHINFRISLRSSSMREPRDPLLKVLVYYVYTRTTLITEFGCTFGGHRVGRLSPSRDGALARQSNICFRRHG